MPMILVVDDMRIIREPIAQAIQGAGYDTVGASSGEEALAEIRKAVPDLVLLDLQMPGIGGLAVLKAMRLSESTAKTPVILLTGSADRDTVLAAAAYGVRDYVLKSRFEIGDLLGRIGKQLASVAAVQAPLANSRTTPAASPEPTIPPASPAEAQTSKCPVLNAADTQRRIARAEIKALPGTVAELITLTGSRRSTLPDVAGCLKRDPPLCARVLKVSNSAAFVSNRARTSTVEDAIRLIGLSEVNRLATSIGIMENFGAATMGSKFIRHWQHSLAVATLMERIAAGHESMPPPGLAYTVGLCERLAKIMVHQLFPAQDEAIELLASQSNGSASRHYRGMLGLPFAEIVHLLLARTGLPDPVLHPLREYFASLAEPHSSTAGSMLTRMLRVANGYVNGLMLAPTANEIVTPFERSACRFSEEVPEPSVPDVDELRTHAATLAATMANLTPEQMSAILDAPIRKRTMRLTYLRDSSFASFDPLASMLSLMVSELTVGTDEDAARSDPASADLVLIATPRAPSEAMRSLAKTATQNGIRVVWLSSVSKQAMGMLPTTPHVVNALLAG